MKSIEYALCNTQNCVQHKYTVRAIQLCLWLCIVFRPMCTSQLLSSKSFCNEWIKRQMIHQWCFDCRKSKTHFKYAQYFQHLRMISARFEHATFLYGCCRVSFSLSFWIRCAKLQSKFDCMINSSLMPKTHTNNAAAQLMCLHTVGTMANRLTWWAKKMEIDELVKHFVCRHSHSKWKIIQANAQLHIFNIEMGIFSGPTSAQPEAWCFGLSGKLTT